MKSFLLLFLSFTIFASEIKLIDIDGIKYRIEKNPYTGIFVKKENKYLLYEGYYKNGIKNGIWKYYYPQKNKIYEKITFKNGKPENYEYFFPNGKKSNLPVFVSKPIKNSLNQTEKIKITVSSHIKSNSGNNYNKENLTDKNLKTAWVPKSKSRIFTINAPEGLYLKGYGFVIFNGYLKNKKLWKYNSRIEMMKVYLNNKPIGYVYLEDIMKPQKFFVNTKGIEGTLKFEIISVYKGQKYPQDVAISEIYAIDYSDCIRGDETEAELFCQGDNADENGYCLEYSYCGDSDSF